MAQQTLTATSTIIDDLQSLSSKILELSKTNKLPEQNAIELNKDLLKLYNKTNNSTTNTYDNQFQQEEIYREEYGVCSGSC